MGQKLTPWFPPEVKPVHKGAYEVKTIGIGKPFKMLWAGRCWRRMDDEGKAFEQEREWRGLAHPPKEQP